MLRTLLCLLSVLCLAGCTSESEPPPKEVLGAKPAKPAPPDPPVVGGGVTLPYPRGGRVEITDNQQGPEVTERVKAEVGVGAKGRRLEDERLVQTIVTPAVALFRTRERVVFEIQIPKALQLYEATNGKKPATQEEFFKQIIEANRIPLPPLPEGQRYVYDPQKGELLVERPAK